MGGSSQILGFDSKCWLDLLLKLIDKFKDLYNECLQSLCSIFPPVKITIFDLNMERNSNGTDMSCARYAAKSRHYIDQKKELKSQDLVA